MCTPTSSERPSIAQSARAVFVSSWILARAVGGLLLAVLTAPGQLRFGVRSRLRPAPVGGIDIQIHLEDRRCIANLRRILRLTLRRSAATWAPMVLPVHRIVVGA